MPRENRLPTDLGPTPDCSHTPGPQTSEGLARDGEEGLRHKMWLARGTVLALLGTPVRKMALIDECWMESHVIQVRKSSEIKIPEANRERPLPPSLPPPQV